MAILAKGVYFGIDDSGFTQISNIVTFSPSGVTWKTQDTTSHDSTTPVTTLVPTIRNDGKISLVITPFNPTDTNHALLRSLSQSGAANNFRITYPGSKTGSFDFSGYVTMFTPDTPTEGIYSAKVDITAAASIDDDAPKLVSVTVTDAHAGTYVTSDVIELTATFDEIVKVTGTPRIAVVLGSGTVQCNYASGSNSNKLVFHYTVGGGDSATASEFSISSPIALNSGTIKDVNVVAPASLTFTPPTTTAFIVN